MAIDSWLDISGPPVWPPRSRPVFRVEYAEYPAAIDVPVCSRMTKCKEAALSPIAIEESFHRFPETIDGCAIDRLHAFGKWRGLDVSEYETRWSSHFPDAFMKTDLPESLRGLTECNALHELRCYFE